ncbi:MAG: S9 family peptidase [Ignavibacteriae bacterium HGW-Ignavibacteriae-2]|nr:S9 family peptidase [Bacteroidota bacterium]PKL89750.1 MAG: S9 family peptidase [Ignavibacteriae bacterium HGW-Ignavibacteriae-2]
MRSIKIIIISLLFVFSIQAQQKKAITVEDMWAMKRVSNVTLSPDGKTVAFAVKIYDMEQNSGQSDIYIINSDGTNLRPIKNSKDNETSPAFTPDGKLSYQMKGQIRICDLNGKNDIQVTDLYTGCSDVRWSADGTKILFISSVYPECLTQECNKNKDDEIAASKVNVMVFEELMYRHWDDWRGPKRSHLFSYDLKSKKYSDLTLNSNYDVPPIALGSSNDFNISPDGNEVVFTMNQSEMLATSTNNDIFILNLNDLQENKATSFKKISKSEGNDNQPVYSPDGKYIAFVSMARAGFEADKQALMLYERNTGELNELSGMYDISVGEFIWSPDSKSIYYTAAYEIYNSIYKIDVESGSNEIVLKERVNSSLNISPDGKTLYFDQQRNNLPSEAFSFNLESKELKQLTFMNKELLSKLEMNDIETFWSDGAEGAKVQSILVKPPFFDPSKKYPLIFLIHGGPQGHWDDNFHYRWNTQMFASKGYVVVAPNPRGSTGYGQKFTDEISKDWGGKVYIDLMNAYDYAIENYKFIDKENTFAAGASYGGYMINWIEGHTDRFNALLCHDGVYNLISMYGTTEELWFPEWEYNGTPWESKDIYEKWSPSNFVQNFKTPMLVVHGGKDFRVPEGQAFELFTALQKRGVESKFVYFPEETHFVTKPQNARFWWNTMFEWFNKYITR